VGALFPELAVGRVALAPGEWRDLGGASVPPPEGRTLCVAAVARPELFVVQVEAQTGARTEMMAFPDHYEFGPADVKAMRARAGDRTVVVTEKDAVKLQPHRAALEPVRVLTQALRWEAGEAALTGIVTAAKGP
jgi:tetraacyldisaccharide-1-P 4'-kinase